MDKLLTNEYWLFAIGRYVAVRCSLLHSVVVYMQHAATYCNTAHAKVIAKEWAWESGRGEGVREEGVSEWISESAWVCSWDVPTGQMYVYVSVYVYEYVYVYMWGLLYVHMSMRVHACARAFPPPPPPSSLSLPSSFFPSLSLSWRAIKCRSHAKRHIRIKYIQHSFFNI